MFKPVAKVSATVAVSVLAVGAAMPTFAADATRAVVIGVHNEQATAPVAKALGVSNATSDGGRFAVVQLRKGAYGNRSYALVYVPRDIKVSKNDVVELTPAEMDLWTNPGKGVVTRQLSQIADAR